MANGLDDVFNAIDSYMKNNGKGEAYLASRVSALFDTEDSPLNVKTGPLKTMGERVVLFYKRIYKAELEVKTLVESVGKTSTNLKFFNISIKKGIKELDRIETIVKALSGRSRAIRDASRTRSTSSDGDVTFTKITNLLERINSRDKLSYINMFGTSYSGKSIAIKLMDINNTLHKILEATDNSDEILSKEESPKEKSRWAKIMSIFERSKSTVSKTSTRDMTDTRTTTNIKGEKGIISKILGWVFFGLEAFAGIYFLQKFLNETAIGKVIKEKVKGLIHEMGEWIGKQFESGEITRVFSEVFGFIRKITVVLFGGMVDFVDKHQDAIGATIKNVGVTFWKDLVVPIYGIITKKIQDIFAEQNFDFAKDGLMGTAWKAIKAAGISTMAVLVPWFIMRSLPIIGGPFKLLEKTLQFGLKGITGGFGETASKLGILAIAITATIAVYDKFQEVGNKLIEFQTKWSDQIKNALELNENNIKGFSEESKKLESEGDLTGASIAKINAEIETLMQTKNKHLEDIDTKEKATYKGWNIFGIADMYSKAVAAREKTLQLKADKPLDDKIKDLTDELLKLTDIKAKTVKVKDAIIVEPHSKDQIMMAKSGGPIDDMMKGMLQRFDDMMLVMAQGFNGVANATIQGSNGVISAVGASGGSGSKSLSTGYDPVKDHRNRTSAYVR